MKPLVIYHANCADGFGAAFAAWLRFGEDADTGMLQDSLWTLKSCWTGYRCRNG